MRFQANLARRPFHNRKTFWIAFLLILAALAGFNQWILANIAQTEELNKRIENRITKEKEEVKKLETNQPKEVSNITPQQLFEIESAARLITRRNFSWSSLLVEFERLLPSTVKILSIGLKGTINQGEKGQKAETETNPSASPVENSVDFTIQVSAKSVEDITKTIAAADKRGIFQLTPRTQSSGANGEILYSLDLTYIPRLKEVPKSLKDIENDQVAKKREVKDE